MKHLVWMFLGLGLVACVGVSAPTGGTCQQGVCIKVQIAEPIPFDEPVNATITVTTEKDMPRLGVSLYFGGQDIAVEGSKGWEKGGVDWLIEAKASNPTILTRRIKFPPQEGTFQVIVSAMTPSGLRVTDGVYVNVSRAGGKMYLSGSEIPITPAPLPTVTPGPSFTPAPWMRTRAPTPPPQPFSTPAMLPYP